MSIVKAVGPEMPLKAENAFSLAGKVVIVTGAAGNIGSAIVEVFAANGAQVVMTDRAGDRLTNVAAQLRESCPSIADIGCDLAVPDDLKSLVSETSKQFGRIDGLINCGAIPGSTTIADEDVADFERLYNTNVRSIWLLIKHCIEPMSANGGGAVVNISSINGIRAQFFCSLYAGTKSAVLAMTRELAVELAPRNIRVNSVSPGLIPNTSRRLDWMQTYVAEPWASELVAEFEPRVQGAYNNSQPLSMTGHGHDIAMACLYLSSTAARFVTGADIVVDGGQIHEMHEVESRFSPQHKSPYRELRERLLALPDEAWKTAKPGWLLRHQRRTS